MKIEIDHYHHIYETYEYKITIDDNSYLALSSDLEPYLTKKQFDRLIISQNGYGTYSIKNQNAEKLKKILTPYKY